MTLYNMISVYIYIWYIMDILIKSISMCIDIFIFIFRFIYIYIHVYIHSTLLVFSNVKEGTFLFEAVLCFFQNSS